VTIAANTDNNFQAELEADVAATFGDVFGAADAEPAFRPHEPAPSGEPAGEAGGGATAAPVTPPAAPTEQPAAQPPAAPEPAPATPPVQPAPLAPPATPPAAPTTNPEEALRQSSLEAQVQALQLELQQLRANPQPATPGTQPAAPQQPSPAAESGEPQIERYNLTLPQHIQAALTSDDPNQMLAGIQTVINDLGTIVHNRVLEQTRTLVTQTVQQAVGGIRQDQALTQQQQEVETYRQSYYEKFPSHNSPLILPLLQAETARLAAEYPNARFDDNFINSLGSRVNNAIAQLTGGGQQPSSAQPAVPPVVPPRPAASLPSGTRAQAPGSELEGSDLIEQTLSAF